VLRLSDDQLAIVQRLALPLQPLQRTVYLERVAELLSAEIEIGDGSVSRAARQAQVELLRPAAMNGRFGAGSKWDR